MKYLVFLVLIGVVFALGCLFGAIISAHSAEPVATHTARFTATLQGRHQDWLGSVGFYTLSDSKTEDEFLLVRSGGGGVVLLPLYREVEKNDVDGLVEALP